MSLNARHRLKSLSRFETLVYIDDLFKRECVEFLLLKGMALRGLLYTQDALRPMSDIDLLLPVHQLVTAQTLLQANGFVDGGHPSDAMHNHHHLPGLTLSSNGQTVLVELHADALSGDVRDSITTNNLIDEPQHLRLNGRGFKALGHIDMLRHLCRHTFEPAERIRMISMVDIVRYASRFEREVNWDIFRGKRSFVTNTLSHLHYVSPLPDSLSRFRPDSSAGVPGGVGRGIIKPASVFDKSTRQTGGIKRLLNPPAWWLHIFYNHKPGSSLKLVKSVKHPLTLAKWLARRLIAIASSKISDAIATGFNGNKKQIAQ